MLFEYLEKNYSTNEPIFLSDIKLPNIKDNYLRQMFKELCDEGKIRRYENGVYYIPSVSRLRGGTTLTPTLVAQYKYVTRNGNVDGYYSGYTFANQLGITTQVPFKLEIVSNSASGNFREIDMNGQRIILRKPKATVTKKNSRILQFLDLLKDIDEYADDETVDVKERIASYARAEKFTKKEIDQYISLYPDKVYRNFYEMGVYDVLA